MMSATVGLLFLRFVPAFVGLLLLGRRCFKRVDEVFFRRFVMGLLLTVAVLALVAGVSPDCNRPWGENRFDVGALHATPLPEGSAYRPALARLTAAL